MKDRLIKLTKEPLIYFFVLGFVVFGLQSFLNSEKQVRDEDPFTVEVVSADIEWITATGDSASTAYWNPAAMTLLDNKALEIQVLAG